MSREGALRTAIDLLNMPSNVRAHRKLPLPDGTELVLAIAAGDTAAEQEAASLIDRPRSQIKAAAGFFVEQILLSPESDSYRILGARTDAPPEVLRNHMALIMRWLHPDLNPNDIRSVHAQRVVSAWDDVKTPEKRQVYDAARLARSSRARARTNGSVLRNRLKSGRPIAARWTDGKSAILLRRVLAYFSKI